MQTIQALCCSLLSIVLCITLANPVYTKYIQNPLKNGRDIVLILDLSKSMLAEDISPNRIEAGKTVLSHFIEARNQDRIALVGFAGKPFIFSPLSFDQKGLTEIVQNIGVDSIRQEIP